MLELLLVGTKRENGPPSEAVLNTHDDAHTGIGVADLFERDDVRQHVHSRTAIFFGNEHSHQAKLGHLTDDVGRIGVVQVAFGCPGHDLAPCKVAGHFLDCLVVLGKFKHGSLTE